MIASDKEIKILNRLKNCRYLPGSFDKKFPTQIDMNNISPRQKYFIYKLGYKYRKQINDKVIELVCKNFLENNSEPQSRREASKILTAIIKG